jgi:DNA repair exonuclease SbcCD ATPase subunit
MMAMAADVPFRTRQATIFTSYVKTFYEGTIRGKLERYGVVPVKVIDPNKSSSYDLSAAPYVIVLLELMDPKEAKKIREEAKRLGKRCIVLHRQIRDWDKAFTDLEQQEAVTAPAPPSSRVTSTTPTVRALASTPPAPEPEEEIEDESEPSPEYKEFLELYEQENKELIAEKKALEAKIAQLEANIQWAASQATDRVTASKYNELARKLQSAEEELTKLRSGLEKTKLERDQLTQAARTANLQRDEQLTLARRKTQELEKLHGELTRSKSAIVDLENQLEAGANTLRALQQELDDAEKKRVEVPESLRRELEAYKTGQEKLSKDLVQAQELVKKQTTELFTLRKENKELRADPRLGADDAELARLRKENELLKGKATLRSTEDFLKLREALATVWRLGAMSDKDVLEKLMNWKPKED